MIIQTHIVTIQAVPLYSPIATKIKSIVWDNHDIIPA